MHSFHLSPSVLHVYEISQFTLKGSCKLVLTSSIKSNFLLFKRFCREWNRWNLKGQGQKNAVGAGGFLIINLYGFAMSVCVVMMEDSYFLTENIRTFCLDMNIELGAYS